eukprot:scaffold2552_cov380-Prasinococcus_capsulatus_cf.AAC.2
MARLTTSPVCRSSGTRLVGVGRHWMRLRCRAEWVPQRRAIEYCPNVSCERAQVSRTGYTLVEAAVSLPLSTTSRLVIGSRNGICSWKIYVLTPKFRFRVVFQGSLSTISGILYTDVDSYAFGCVILGSGDSSAASDLACSAAVAFLQRFLMPHRDEGSSSISIEGA